MMKAEKVGARPLRLPKKGHRKVSTQFAALCWRRKKNGKLKVLLVTSRGTGRWLVPKGWPMNKRTPPEAAAIEAFEEAGVTGVIGTQCIGLYTYSKAHDGDKDDQSCAVAVYPLEVSKKHAVYPEKGQRRRKWMSPKKAAKKVEEPELKEILKAFEPD